MKHEIRKVKLWKKLSFALGLFAILLVIFFSTDQNMQVKENVAFAQRSSITIITLADDNALLGNSTFTIEPDPSRKSNVFTIKDDSASDFEKDKKGIISITGIPNENYTITQTATTSGYIIDKMPKTLQVKDSSEVVTFTNKANSTYSKDEQPIQSITYTAKFVCGSVFGDEGPLRPGHYDTDISIFNKQSFPMNILWSVVQNDGPSSNAIIKNLQPETSTGIVCKEIRKLLDLGDNSESIVEGFAIIRIQLDSILETSEMVLRNTSEDEINLLDVQVFYTANALPTLPHEVIIDKISFYIIQDKSNKIPKDMIRKPLDISIPSSLHEVSNTETKIKNILAEKYELQEEDFDKITIRIKSVSVGVGSLIDDHAISLHVVKPQASFS